MAIDYSQGTIRELQRKLNEIRAKAPKTTWGSVKVDGLWGNETLTALRKFQEYAHLSVDGIPGSQTWSALRNYSSATSFLSAAPSTQYYLMPVQQIIPPRQTEAKTGSTDTILNAMQSTPYKITSYSIGAAYKTDMITNASSPDKGLAFVLAEWEKVLNTERESLLRRLSKFPAKKQMRARNVIKQLGYCKKFLEKANRYGINKAVMEFSGEATKENAIRYIKMVAEAISQSPLSKGLRAFTKSFEKIKTIISPIIGFLNKIPGLKYFSVIEKIVKATLKMLQSDFEGAFKLYLDGLRELLEQIVIDFAVAALVAAGGWIMLVIAIVVIIGAFIIDYFIFSDNPGDSYADKKLNVKTYNVVQDNAAPYLYHLMNH